MQLNCLVSPWIRPILVFAPVVLHPIISSLRNYLKSRNSFCITSTQPHSFDLSPFYPRPLTLRTLHLLLLIRIPVFVSVPNHHLGPSGQRYFTRHSFLYMCGHKGTLLGLSFYLLLHSPRLLIHISCDTVFPQKKKKKTVLQVITCNLIWIE